MQIEVWIEPHERGEALEAYRQWLSVEQAVEIDQAPAESMIRIRRIGGNTTVLVVEEG